MDLLETGYRYRPTNHSYHCITESADSNYEQFGEKRLAKIIRKNKDKTPKEIIYKILEEVIKYSKNGQYSDDKTLVVIKRVRG